jgi:hypothetical protein
MKQVQLGKFEEKVIEQFERVILLMTIAKNKRLTKKDAFKIMLDDAEKKYNGIS